MSSVKKENGGRETARKNRREAVIEAALSEFCKNGIEATSIQQIADAAEIGVASVYRYFSNKGELAVYAAILNWRRFFAPMAVEALKERKGRDQLQAFMSAYLNLFEQNPEGFLFLEDFDNFISHLDIRPKAMPEYEKEFMKDDELMEQIITLGVNEGSFRTDIDLGLYNSMAGHAVTSLAQKLLKRGHVIAQDELYPGMDQLKILIETLIQSILVEEN